MDNGQPSRDPVSGLIDIPLPAPVSLWPQTWEAQAAIAVFAVGVVIAAWWFMHRQRANRYRREALGELDRIVRSLASREADAIVSALALLVRRVALTAYPRERIASLSGSAWLTFLDFSYGGHEFSRGAGRLLACGPYVSRRVGADDVRDLVDLVRRWIRSHHD